MSRDLRGALAALLSASHESIDIPGERNVLQLLALERPGDLVVSTVGSKSLERFLGNCGLGSVVQRINADFVESFPSGAAGVNVGGSALASRVGDYPVRSNDSYVVRHLWIGKRL